MKGASYTKGHIYSHICSANHRTGDEPPSISLYPTRRATVFSHWVLTMSTAVPVAADLFFGRQPSFMMVQAHRPGRNWQAKLPGICWGSDGPRLWSARLPAAIYYWTQIVSFPPHSLSSTKNSILQAECKLNQSWHAERPWVGWRSCHRCVAVSVCAPVCVYACMCVCVLSVGFVW